jgi:hypothetical protein
MSGIWRFMCAVICLCGCLRAVGSSHTAVIRYSCVRGGFRSKSARSRGRHTTVFDIYLTAFARTRGQLGLLDIHQHIIRCVVTFVVRSERLSSV